jgi:hypothetical protein
MLDLSILASLDLVDCFITVLKALLTGKDCMVYLDAAGNPENDPDKTRNSATAITVKEQKITMHSMWLPSKCSNFQERQARNENRIQLKLPEDVWQSCSPYVCLGTGLEDFLEFLSGLAILFAGTVGMGQNVYLIASDIYLEMRQAAEKEAEGDEALLRAFERYLTDLQKNPKPFAIQTAPNSPLLDKKLAEAMQQTNGIKKNAARMAKTTIMGSGAIFLNAFKLDELITDEERLKKKLLALIKQDQEAECAAAFDKEDLVILADDDGAFTKYSEQQQSQEMEEDEDEPDDLPDLEEPSAPLPPPPDSKRKDTEEHSGGRRKKLKAEK